MNAKTIIRAPRSAERPYFITSRAAAQDDRLSLQARGMLWYLLSKPDDWEVKIDDLMKAGSCGRNRVYAILKELREYGYLTERSKTRQKDGTFTWTEYQVIEEPNTKPEQAESTENKPYPKNQHMGAGSPYPQNPHTENGDIIQNTEDKDTPNGVGATDEDTTGTDGTTEKPTSDRVAIRQEVIDGCKFADSVRNEKELYGRSGRITRYLMGQPAVEHKVTYTVVHEHWRAKPGDFTRFVQYWRGKYGDADVPRSLEKLHERWCEWREAEDRQQARLQKQLDATSPTLQAESVLYGGTEQEAA